MVRLVLGNLLDVVVEGLVETSVGEVLLGELVEAVTVEGVLEMLQSQGVVENNAYSIDRQRQ
jgi:hypothetical protein